MTNADSPISPSPRFPVFAAGGVLLFAGALIAGAWFFLYRLAAAPDHEPFTANVALWNAALFLGFATHHSVMARSGAKTWISRLLPSFTERSVYVWVASLLFLAVCLGWRPTREVAWALPGPAAWFGIGVQVCGLLVTALGAQVIDLRELGGLRQKAQTAAGPSAESPAAPSASRPGQSAPIGVISTRGPYGVVRHPIYFGWVLLVWGTPVMTSGRLLFAVVSTFYLFAAIPLEERSLVQIHGDDYRRYQREVRWRLLPGLF